MTEESIYYNYKFIFNNSDEKVYNIELDEDKIEIKEQDIDNFDEWIELHFQKCENCTLKNDKYCPVAKNISTVVKDFRSKDPDEEIELIIETEPRNYIKKVSLSEGVSSLLGLYMVISGCPIMKKLKPMVKYHLPFSTAEDTNYRVLSMYLLAQYFEHMKQREPDWELSKLIDIYRNIQTVNVCFEKRLSGAADNNVCVKALRRLNSFAQNIPAFIIDNMLNDLEDLFDEYVERSCCKADKNETICYEYIFDLKDQKKEIKIKLNKHDLSIISEIHSSERPFTLLECEKCSNCTLNQKYCPIALNLSETIDYFKDSISYEKVHMTIKADSRIYEKVTTVQNGLSSLFGIIMVTSGCPVMKKLKPMVAFHLPFATLSETNYRVMTMYLLAQYFVKKNGGHPDWELKGLIDIYENVQTVNQCFCKRLNTIDIEDASLNALVRLSCFADFVPTVIVENMLEDIDVLFSDS